MAATPVLAVPANTANIPHRAVVAVDFSPTSVLAARTVARWLEPGDVLHVVHVSAAEHDAHHGHLAEPTSPVTRDSVKSRRTFVPGRKARSTPFSCRASRRARCSTMLEQLMPMSSHSGATATGSGSG